MTHLFKRSLIPILLLGLFIVIPMLLGSTLEETSYTRDSKSGFIAPEAPQHFVFAGEKIDLSRADLHERMDREIISFCYMHTTSTLILKRANRYFPQIEKILKECGIPDDLKYLMVIESSLDTQAYSPAGAAGLWQFMKGTARDFGLEVNANIDERYHVEKSTRAACQYLKGAYQKYQSWLTAAASYNAGQGRISGELAKQNVSHAADLWLVQETSRYMFRLMAVKMMMENPQQFGFYLKPNQLYPAMDYKVVRVNTQINDLVAFAKQHQISYAQLKEANPWLRGRFLENKSRRTYEVLIPTQQSLHYKPAQVRVHNPAWVVH